jgi:hypothetical protein
MTVARKKGTTERAKISRALDDITPKIVKLRDEGKCQRCGQIPQPKGYHWAHVKTRRDHWLRWEPLNALGLCYGCHAWFDSHKAEGMEWFTTTWPERDKYLWQHSLSRPHGTIPITHLRALLESHRQKLKELQAESKMNWMDDFERSQR